MRLLFLQLLLETVAVNGGAVGVDATTALGSPRFATRQHAERAIAKTWPLSHATLKLAAASNDLHTSERAKSILTDCRKRHLNAAGDPPRADFIWRVSASTTKSSRAPWLEAPLQRALWREPAICFDLGWAKGVPFIDGTWPDESYRAVMLHWAMQAMESGVPPTLVRLWITIGSGYERRVLSETLPMPRVIK